MASLGGDGLAVELKRGMRRKSGREVRILSGRGEGAGFP